jgi:hypothetical protein
VVASGQHEAEALAMAEELLDYTPLVIGALKRLVSEVLPVESIERMVATNQTIGRCGPARTCRRESAPTRSDASRASADAAPAEPSAASGTHLRG